MKLEWPDVLFITLITWLWLMGMVLSHGYFNQLKESNKTYTKVQFI